MKINIEFDMTPEEFRQALGLADMESFQNEVMNHLIEKMKSGEAGYDAMSLFQQYMNTGVEMMQKNFMDFMGQATNHKKTM